MFGLRILITSALAASGIVMAGYLPEVAGPAAFHYNAKRQTANSSSPAFNGPYSTRGRDIVNSKGEKVTWTGVNWPMSGT